MNKKKLWLFFVPSLIALSACKQHYELTSISRERILIDNRYDKHPNEKAVAFLAPYQKNVDSIMSPVVGEVSEYMAKAKPESSLSNLLADILKWGGKDFKEKVDFAVYNMGGIRAAFAKGKVTYGNVVDVAPFENKICFLTLSGNKVLQLFKEIAAAHGEGLSNGANLIISKDGKLLSAKVNGQDVNPTASYRIATLDYLAQGNDGLTAFKSGTDVVSPQTTENNVRFIIMAYLKEQMAKGKPVERKIEGRIVEKD